MSLPFHEEPNLPQVSLTDPHSGDRRSAETLAMLENQLLKQKLAAQTQLMHLLTHQLATPLTSLSGSVHLLVEPGLETDQRREFLDIVQHQVRRLRNLLKDLTEIRNLETGNLETQAIDFCVPSLIEEVLEAFALYPIQLQVSSGLSLAWGDRWQVSQVLVNLISNAIKYSPNRELIEIGVTLQPDQFGGQLEVSVRDRGLGVPLEDQPHLFQRFYRVRHRDRQDIDGTGLGLSLCKLLVEKQGGQMGFESIHGQGSRFYFTLPTVRMGVESRE